jgi:hypothetical protein
MDIRLIARTDLGHAGLADHAQRRLSYRLGHCSERIAHVSVKLGNTGSRRGFRDVYCVMQVQLRGARAATVVDIGGDPHDTIDRAADRVSRLAEETLRQADDRHRTNSSAKEMVA